MLNACVRECVSRFIDACVCVCVCEREREREVKKVSLNVHSLSNVPLTNFEKKKLIRRGEEETEM